MYHWKPNSLCEYTLKIRRHFMGLQADFTVITTAKVKHNSKTYAPTYLVDMVTVQVEQVHRDGDREWG